METGEIQSESETRRRVRGYLETSALQNQILRQAIPYHYGNRKRGSTAPVKVHFTDPQKVDCSTVGKLDGIPIVHGSFMRPDGSWFDRKMVPDGVRLSEAPAGRPEHVRRVLDELKLSPWNFSLIIPRRNRLVHEQPLLSFALSPHGHVTAVYKSTSGDNGATWSAAQITRDAENFRLGELLEAQGYVASPGGTARPVL